MRFNSPFRTIVGLFVVCLSAACATVLASRSSSDRLPVSAQPTNRYLVGSWRVVRFCDVDSLGRESFPLGAQPRGIFVYSPDGQLSLQAMRSPGDSSGKGARQVGAVEGYFGYFGSYTITSDTTVIHHVIGGTIPSYIDTDQPRLYKIWGAQHDSLTIGGPSSFHCRLLTKISAGAPPMPAGVRFVSRTDWGAHAPVLPMTPHVPIRLTIHHTGTAMNFSRTIEEKMRGLQAFSQRDDSLESGKKKPAWADVPYHYYIAVDGSVAEGREWNYAGDTNTEYNPAGHLLVVVEGSFNKDTLTTAQRRSLDALVPALAHHFKIRGSMLGGHRDFAVTECPGNNLYAELPRLRALIDQSSRQER